MTRFTTTDAEIAATVHFAATELLAESDEVSEKLKELLSIHDQSKPTDDELFGTNDRKKVGDTWEPRKDLLLRHIRRPERRINLLHPLEARTTRGDRKNIVLVAGLRGEV